MNKKIVLLSLCTAGALLTACSDDPSSPNVEPNLGYSSAIEEPIIDPITGEIIPTSSAAVTDPVIDPNTGEIIPASSAASAPIVDPNNPQPMSSAVVQPGMSSAVVQPGMSSAVVQPGVSSSAAAPAQSSSSGLKDYNDNHAPKESYLPAAGFYSNLTIQPLSGKQGGQVKCTFDGSFPTQNSESITAAKQITENTVIRCSEFLNGQALDTTTQTYFINEKVSMPVVALTVNHHDMFDSTDGLYATGNLTNNGGAGGMWGGIGVGGDDTNNPKCTEPCKQANFWKEDELPVHVEFFENGSSTKTKNWEIDAGISIIGNYSRYKPKKSVAIKMDDSLYNDKSLKYSLFKTRPEAKRFKSFNLRNNGNRFWTDYAEDAMLTSLMEGTEVDYQRSRQVVVFYNGEYFGIHDMRERLNRSFAETNYGIDNKSINVVKNCSNGDKGYQNGWCPSGTNGASASEFAQLVNQITTGNFEGENNQSYKQVSEKLNMVSFAQYMIAEMYSHNGDWPNNNIRFWGSPNKGIPFKAMMFDLDHGYGFTPGIMDFDVENQNMYQWVLGSATMDNNGGNQGGQQPGMGGWDMGGFGGGANTTLGQMLKKLLSNPDFKRLFINQASILLNEYLTYEKVQKAFQNIMSTIPSSEQQRDEQRWPRNQAKYHWSPDGSDIMQFARNRTETVKQETKQYFGLSDEVSVSINASGMGSVLVEGTKLPSSNYSGKFFSGTSMKVEAVAGSGAIFMGWSDGSTENPRIVQINGATTITAQFK
ncbi:MULTISPECIES: CotH kinase family protein [unclassified Fibrobacter]|uniref:CotH kinase family protein n=1 Tax=unclassified Fibrobacter TaxID=2634177 RepID=UPI000D7B15C5|nr:MULTISPECIES: CotH kinase family protein [unclassified Fibrobacter]PWJ61141.1 CotH protein [Fibrobacter sp. UWR4]PZW65599.1 CotH protein [Fibrobacter sp. UWR1]